MQTILKSPDNELVGIELDAFCHDCQHRHRINVSPHAFSNEVFNWERKHQGHRFEFLLPERTIPKGFDDRVFEQAGVGPWWLDYKHNADIKLAYIADAAATITLANLAEDSGDTWLVGRESGALENTTNKALDIEVTGKITVGTNPTASRVIQLRCIKSIEDTPTWPDVFDGTDSAETITNTFVRDCFPLIWSTYNASTSDVTHPIAGALTLAQAFGVVPSNYVFFVSHNTEVNLKNSAGDQAIVVRGVYATST